MQQRAALQKTAQAAAAAAREEKEIAARPPLRPHFRAGAVGMRKGLVEHYSISSLARVMGANKPRDWARTVGEETARGTPLT